MRFEFILTDREFVRAWLAEYYLGSKRAVLRIFGGPALALFGWRLHVLYRGSPLAIVGVLGIGYGIYFALKPLLQVALELRKRRRLGAGSIATVVELDDDGIHIQSGAATADFAWERIARAGQRLDYLWFETHQGTKGTIPLRAVSDQQALEQRFREQGKWG